MDDEASKPLGETHQYLQANKTYVAVKCLGDGNLLLYMAVSTNEEAGWEEGGLNLIQQKSLCNKLADNVYIPEKLFKQ